MLSFFYRCKKVSEYELNYADVVPKDKQAVTTKRNEEERHHEVFDSALFYQMQTKTIVCFVPTNTTIRDVVHEAAIQYINSPFLDTGTIPCQTESIAR